MTEDPRQTRTRAALADALVRLLETTPLDDVSVAELCRSAGVHRTTFYKHADSVGEFAVEVISRDLDALSAVEPMSGTADGAAAEYLTALRATLTHVASERAVFRAMLGSRARGAFRAALAERLRERARSAVGVFVAHRVAGVPDSPRAREEAAAFIAGALVGVIAVWAEEDDTDAAAASERIARLMPMWWPTHAY